MNDKTFARFLFVMIALFVVWWLFLRRRAGAQNVPQAYTGTGTTDPALLTYEANPGKFGPASTDTLNINGSGFNGINQNYMPLFGFVGMAQGPLWQ